MTSEQLDELERLARAATPGPWETDTDANDQQLVLARRADFWVALVPHHCVRSLEAQQEKNARYIAAANPDAVLALIARVGELEAERDRLAAEVERLRVAARDFLTNHWMRSLSAYIALSAALAEAPTPARTHVFDRPTPAREEGQ